MHTQPTSDLSNRFVPFSHTPDAFVRAGCATPSEPALRHRQSVVVRDSALTRVAHEPLPPLLADWLDVAMAVYAADRRTRRPKQSADGLLPWRRRLTVTVPVRRMGVWTSPGVIGALTELLAFLTEDEWQFDFVSRDASARSSEAQPFLFSAPTDRPLAVALLSGGLDSFAGIAAHIAAHPDEQHVLVSAATNTRLAAAQRRQARALGTLATVESHHVVVGFHLAKSDDRLTGERTQRTRGFVFLTLGCIAALLGRARELNVFENGIGAINLPLDATHIGAQASRGVHPLTLLRMESFVEALTGEAFTISNPSLFATKAEMCASPAVYSLRDHIRSTYSCDGFPGRRSRYPQCGKCTSCVLRRLSLERARLAAYDPTVGFEHDIFSGAHVTRRTLIQPFEAMQWQAGVIGQCVGDRQPWRALVEHFPDLARLAAELTASAKHDRATLRRNLIELYRRHFDEFAAFLRSKSAPLTGRLRPPMSDGSIRRARLTALAPRLPGVV